MQLYHHKTSGGAEFLMDTFIKCRKGHKEGVINNKTRYVVRIDGDITKDAELYIKADKNKLLEALNRLDELANVAIEDRKEARQQEKDYNLLFNYIKN